MRSHRIACKGSASLQLEDFLGHDADCLLLGQRLSWPCHCVSHVGLAAGELAFVCLEIVGGTCRFLVDQTALL